jgi:hypothetical protein
MGVKKRKMIIITEGQSEETQEGKMEREISTQSTHDFQ